MKKYNEVKNMNSGILMIQLPRCPVRVGRVYDDKAVICCGYREINPMECFECKVGS